MYTCKKIDRLKKIEDSKKKITNNNFNTITTTIQQNKTNKINRESTQVKNEANNYKKWELKKLIKNDLYNRIVYEKIYYEDNNNIIFYVINVVVWFF